MKATRRTEITTETHETTIIRFAPNQLTAYCAECQNTTPHLTVSQTEKVVLLSALEIRALIKLKQIHYMETETRELLICCHSLEGLANE